MLKNIHNCRGKINQKIKNGILEKEIDDESRGNRKRE